MLRALALVLAAATTLALPPGARSQPPPLEPGMHSGATDAYVLAPRPQRSRAGGCTGGGSGGCSTPVGDKWRRWDMAGSTYAYCYAGCPVPYLLNHSYPYAGLVGVDHYWTGQGVPCRGGKPREFDAQDELAADWKRRAAPGLRFLSYRILSAVPYDAVVQVRVALGGAGTPCPRACRHTLLALAVRTLRPRLSRCAIVGVRHAGQDGGQPGLLCPLADGALGRDKGRPALPRRRLPGRLDLPKLRRAMLQRPEADQRPEPRVRAPALSAS